MIKKIKISKINITLHYSDNHNGVTIMFFGRHNCNNTQRGLELMLKKGFNVYLIINTGKNDKLPEEVIKLKCDYIICFRSWFILSEEILNIPKYYAINLHPGPPNYPGSGCVNFALYNNENHFGITTHIMEKQIDSGDIIDYELFPMTAKCSLTSVLITTHQKLFEQLSNLINNLSSHGFLWVDKKIKENKHVKWTGKRLKINALIKEREITSVMDDKEIERRIRAFHHPQFPVYTEVKGKRFYYKL